MIKKRVISIVAAVAAVSAITLVSVASEDPWKQIENNYYSTNLTRSAMANVEDSEILMCSQIILKYLWVAKSFQIQ